MKKFIMGLLIGGIIAGTITGLAAQYAATEATFKILVNGEEFTSNPPALVVEGSTYLPLRAMGDALGVPVNWNAELGQAEVGVAPSEANAVQDVMKNDNWKLTYNGYKTYSEVNYFKPNTEGNKFLVVFFELENLTNEEGNFGLSSEYYVDDYKTNTTIVGNVDGAQQVIFGQNVAGGKKAKICYVFEVSPEWSKLDLKFNDLLNTDESQKINFTLKK